MGTSRALATEPGERRWTSDVLPGAALLTAVYEDQRFARHTHDAFLIGVNLAGAHRSWYRGAERTVPTGELAVVLPGEVHSGHRVGETQWVYRAAYFRPDFVRYVASEVAGRRVPLPAFDDLAIDDSSVVRRFVAAHRRLERGADPLRAEELLTSALADLIRRHAKPAPSPASVGSEPVRIARAKAYMRDRLDTRITLADIAAQVDLSRYHFLRVFKREVGLTPHAWLTQARVRRAKELLASGVPIASVAHRVGFADQSHLTRRFRTYVGVTPGEYVAGTRSA